MTANRDGGGVHVRLLGGFTVRVGDVEVGRGDWPGRRSAELVALLALADRQVLLREQVIEALWPHLEPAAGAANLRKAAHHARQALGREDAVVLGGGRVAFFPDTPVRTDVARFEQVAAEALGAGIPAACTVAAEEYGGTLLPDSLYEEWTQARRAFLTGRQITLLAAAGQWERLVDADPTDERAYRELMRAALAEGNRHVAIRWYGRLRTALEGRLGITPGPDSRAVYAECVAGLGPATPTFVGRQVELARAVAALPAAAAGSVGALVVRGAGGIGKSTLCRELAAEAGSLGWRTITVSASPGCGAYAPLVAAAEQVLAGDRGVLDTLSAQVRSTLAELTALAAPAPPPVAGLSRHMVFGAVHRLLMATPDAAGVLLVVDDVHLADDGTAEACAQLARADGALPLLVVVSYRPEQARPTLSSGIAALERAGRAAVLDLAPMERAELTTLVTASATGVPRPEALGRILDLAQGNPFFALELVRALGPGEQLSVPRSVWEAVTLRFLDLDEVAVAMLRRLAVVDHDLDPTGVLALTGLAEPDAFALLDAALAAGALVVDGGRYRFRHDLVRTALAEQVPPHERIAMHRDAARRLAAGGAEPALIARHWLDGGQPAEARGPLAQAARRAIKLGAFAEALRHLDTLLTHAPRDPDALCLRAEVLEALGDLGAPAAYALAAEAVGGAGADDIRAKQALAQVKQGDPAGGVRTCPRYR